MGSEMCIRDSHLTALNVCVNRLDKYTQGRPDKSVYALRSEIVRSAIDSDESDGDLPDYPAVGIVQSLKTVRPVERSVLGMTASLTETLANEYDRVELDELVLDAVGVVIPTGGGAWLPVVRKEMRSEQQDPIGSSLLGTRIGVAPESPNLWEELPPEPDDAGASAPVGSSEVVLPLVGGPEVIPGLWETGGQEGMVFVANPDGADVELRRGDRLGAIVPAAAQTTSCSLCGFVDTDAFVNDLTMCDTCGTLLPGGPRPCER